MLVPETFAVTAKTGVGGAAAASAGGGERTCLILSHPAAVPEPAYTPPDAGPYLATHTYRRYRGRLTVTIMPLPVRPIVADSVSRPWHRREMTARALTIRTGVSVPHSGYGYPGGPNRPGRSVVRYCHAISDAAFAGRAGPINLDTGTIRPSCRRAFTVAESR